jgi:deoxyribonuclease IV
MLLGAHMSVSGGLSTAFERAQSIGINTMQVFTKNQNRWQQKPTPQDEIERWYEQQKATGVSPVLSHAAYLINLGSPDEALWQKSTDAFIDELTRAEQLGILGVVVHPGAHMGAGEEAGISRIAAALDLCHSATEGYRTLTILENTAGQGSALGYTFEQLRAILSLTREPERVAFCFDTCHALAAGYDLRTPEEYAKTMDAFEQILGLKRLRCFHFNDSKKGLGSRVDRHDHIGSGMLGTQSFGYILNDPRFDRVPMILETPKGDDMQEDLENLRVLRQLVKA